MKRGAVIIDTNVIVAGLLIARDTSPVSRILHEMLAEYCAVLTRPPLRKLHGLSVAEVDAILTDLAQHAIVLTPLADPPAPDRGDQLLWGLLAARITSAGHGRQTFAGGRGHAWPRDVPAGIRVGKQRVGRADAGSPTIGVSSGTTRAGAGCVRVD